MLAAAQIEFRDRAASADDFFGCDGGHPGTPQQPAIWLFGIEPGWSKQDELDDHLGKASLPARRGQVLGFPIEQQLKWPYGRNAIKLLTAIAGQPARDYRKFAQAHRPFEANARGYFKGNIYPVPCNRVKEWSVEAQQETGFTSKADYIDFVHNRRVPAMRAWIRKHRPSLLIGSGSSGAYLEAFKALAEVTAVRHESFLINGRTKNIAWATGPTTNLLVIPHLSGSRNGLNSFASIDWVGKIVNSKRLVRAQK